MAVYVCVCRCVGVCVWGTEGVYDDVLHPHPSIHPSFIHPFIHHRHDTGMVLYCNARDTIGGGGGFLSGGEVIGSTALPLLLLLCACAGGLRSGREEEGGARDLHIVT